MKNYIVIFLIALFFSCSGDLEDMNVDVKNATEAPAENFFNNAVKNMSDLLSGITYGANGNPFNTTRLLVQQISSVTYNEGTTYYSNFTWDNVYLGVLINLDQSAQVIEATPPTNATVAANQLAIIEIMTVFTYAKLVESFGDIPYSQALDYDNISPAYDADEVIYEDLISRLTTAINTLDEGQASWSQDILYNGDVTGWKKFGSSLLLQMGMRVIDADATLGTQAITAALPNVFTSNADVAQVEHLESQPNTAELWTDLAVGNRRDFVGCEPFVDYMNALEDPRRAVFFQEVDGTDGVYLGSPSGLAVTYFDYSRFGTLFYQPATPVIFMDYSTVEFLLAEAAERGIGGVADAAGHYTEAIRASFGYYGLADSADAYLANPDVDYATAPGTWEEKIGMQKWVALFNQGLEAWTEYRRLDYPVLEAPPLSFVPTVPVRLTYPISEQTLNQANYESAASSVGGDLMTTKLFWDVN
ncbi:Starch-binding associating with outer membrane [Flagellimonas taeanensis]|uniref:Starch-binding associating with outer membrane n=1 Tax=Flagellimonas taeanensis TaxID=1005926 RepID=A0A1M6RMM4_9FLAO|nr:SusD/RagB family nutrient-binding outer membrane lipoprotein [Allomuricauda taeanensis]SFB76058.1 Starch-binding associating with outer membrane [Allomuricauda taeanensis]SHK33694.1 Starch-binding associating with outer membrane [Allomuricauda taeanensis]